MKIAENVLVPYEVMEMLFDLDAKDEDINRVLIRSANVTAENFLGRKLAVCVYMERLQAENGVLTVREYPVVAVAHVEDCESGEAVTPLPVTMDDEDVNLIMLPAGCGNRLFDVEYLAGYEAETVPAPIVEAITKLFVFKRNTFLELQAGNNSAEKHAQMARAMPEEIKELLEPYARKRL